MPGISVSRIPIPFRKAGINWSSYWAQRNPSELVLTPASATQINGSFTINGTGQDGHKVYISTDGATYTLADTLTGAENTFEISELAERTRYYFKVVAFKDANESTPLTAIKYTANYFISKTGSNTSPYDTPAKAATAIATAINYLRTHPIGTGDVVDIGAGTWNGASDFMELSDVDHSNVVIQGAGRYNTIVDAPSGADALSISLADDVIVRSMSLRSAYANRRGYYMANAALTATLEDVAFVDFAATSIILLLGGTTNLINCEQYGRSGGLINVSGDAVLNITDFLSVANGLAKVNGALYLQGTGTINLTNFSILDAGSQSLLITAASTVNLTNGIVSGCNENGSAFPITNTGGATLTITNTHVIGSPWDGDTNYISGDWIDGGGNVFTNADPKFKSTKRVGFIMPKVDDTSSFDYAKLLEPLLAARGLTGSYTVIAGSWNTSNNAELRAMLQRGIIEIMSHGYSHSNLQLTGKIFDVTKAAETITIDRAADTITLSGGGVVSSFRTKTLAVIKAELEGLGATVTARAEYGVASGLAVIALGEIIADGAAVNQIDILIDATGDTGYFKSEIKDSKALIEGFINGDGEITDPQTGVAYVCRGFGHPYNGATADSVAAIKACGYEYSTNVKAGEDGSLDELNYGCDIDVFALQDIQIGYFNIQAETTEAQVRLRAKALGFAVMNTGLVLGMLSHNTSEISIDQWTWALDEWGKFGDKIKVVSRQQMFDYLSDAANGWTDDGDGTFSRAYTPERGDYELETTSPCYGTGTPSGINKGIL